MQNQKKSKTYTARDWAEVIKTNHHAHTSLAAELGKWIVATKMAA